MKNLTPGIIACAVLLFVGLISWQNLISEPPMLQNEVKTSKTSVPQTRLLQNASADVARSTALSGTESLLRQSKGNVHENDRTDNIQKRHVFRAALVERVYGPVLGILNLSSAQVSRLEELLAERNEAIDDLRDIVAEKNGARRDFEMTVHAIDDRFDKELAGFIGAEKFVTLKNLMNMVGSFGRVTGTDAKTWLRKATL